MGFWNSTERLKVDYRMLTWLIEVLDLKQGYIKLCLFWKINLRSSKYKASTLPQSYLSKLMISNSIHKFSEHVPIFILKLGHISPKLFWFKKIVRMLPCLVFIIVFKHSIKNWTCLICYFFPHKICACCYLVWHFLCQNYDFTCVEIDFQEGKFQHCTKI